MTNIYHHRIHYPYLEHHITAPRPAWHACPVRRLARELAQAELGDHVAKNGVMVKKTYSMTHRTEYKVCGDSGRIVKTFKDANSAAEFVYGEQLGLITDSNRTAENS